mgnify:CR=1 FL=1
MIPHFIRHCIKIKLMKKLLLTFLLLGSILPSVEAGVSPEGIPRRPRNFSPEGRLRPRRPRCKTDGQVTVCKMPRPRKCGTLRRPCIPRDYYRPNPPRRIPMPLKYNLPNG